MVCGLPASLSLTESDPVSTPAVAGEKETLIGQFAPGANVAPQVLVSEKLPDAAMPPMFNVASP
jgi:hypothetical protein